MKENKNNIEFNKSLCFDGWIDDFSFADDIKIRHIKPCSNASSENILYYCDPQNADNNMRFILILSGRIDVTADYVKHSFNENSLIELNPTLLINSFEISSNFSCYNIIVSKSFINDTLLDRRPIPIKHFTSLKNRPGIELNPEETNNLKNSIKRIIYYLKQEEHIFKKELIHNTFYNFILELANIVLSHYNLNEADNEPLSRKDQIIMDFIQLLNEHGKLEHSPSFYADKLCISVQYLSLILKERSNNTTADWVAMFLIIQAKSLLRTTSKSIQEIADELHFSDQASFGKFFKKHTTMTPKKYKQEHAFL